MLDMTINFSMLILLVIVAFSWGYEKGRGDALEDEINFWERIKKDKEEEKNNDVLESDKEQ